MRYRIVYYIPNHFTDGRIPLGALTDQPAFIACRVPGPDYLSPAHQALIRTLQAALADPAIGFDPVNQLGPHVDVGPDRLIPDTWPPDWLARKIQEDS